MYEFSCFSLVGISPQTSTESATTVIYETEPTTGKNYICFFLLEYHDIYLADSFTTEIMTTTEIHSSTKLKYKHGMMKGKSFLIRVSL